MQYRQEILYGFKQAAQKLFDMDYTNIYEFGGINTWTGEIVTEVYGSSHSVGFFLRLH